MNTGLVIILVLLLVAIIGLIVAYIIYRKKVNKWIIACVSEIRENVRTNKSQKKDDKNAKPKERTDVEAKHIDGVVNDNNKNDDKQVKLKEQSDIETKPSVNVESDQKIYEKKDEKKVDVKPVFDNNVNQKMNAKKENHEKPSQVELKPMIHSVEPNADSSAKKSFINILPRIQSSDKLKPRERSKSVSRLEKPKVAAKSIELLSAPPSGLKASNPSIDKLIINSGSVEDKRMKMSESKVHRVGTQEFVVHDVKKQESSSGSLDANKGVLSAEHPQTDIGAKPPVNVESDQKKYVKKDEKKKVDLKPVFNNNNNVNQKMNEKQEKPSHVEVKPTKQSVERNADLSKKKSFINISTRIQSNDKLKHRERSKSVSRLEKPKVAVKSIEHLAAPPSGIKSSNPSIDKLIVNSGSVEYIPREKSESEVRRVGTQEFVVHDVKKQESSGSLDSNENIKSKDSLIAIKGYNK